MMNVAVVILTLNAGVGFEKLLEGVKKQELKINRKVIADSESTDETLALAKKYDYEILTVKKKFFNHGSTRKKCVEFLKEMDVVIFLTQDAILFNEKSFCNLLEGFSDPEVAVTYGRQLPHHGASPLAAQNRLFNYPAQSLVKTYEDRFTMGIKTPFSSDSFAAYRISSLIAIGNFPHVIIGEDMYVAAKLLLEGYKIAYLAEACVFHSHNYTVWQEFRRYFDVGVFMGREPWIRLVFGTAEGEGIQLVKKQLEYLYIHYGVFTIPKAIMVNMIKLCAYRFGLYERFLPNGIKRKLSGQGYFF